MLPIWFAAILILLQKYIGIHTRQNVSIKDLDIIMHMYFFQAYGYNAHNSWHYLLNNYFFSIPRRGLELIY